MRRFFLVALLTFAISIAFSFISKGALAFLGLSAGFGVLGVIITVGVVSDIVGVAATVGREAPFHAMAVDKVPGAAHAIWLVRHADRVATFTNDIVGDIAGTLSGAVGAALVFRIVASRPTLSEAMLTTLLVAIIAALTVGGKAYGKTLALRRANDIVFLVARIIHRVEQVLGLNLFNTGNNRQGRTRKARERLRRR